MPTTIHLNTNRAVDLNGLAVPLAQAYFYKSGTMEPRPVYTDPECTIPHMTPVVADGAGVFPPVFDNADGDAKALITDKNGVTLPGYPIDPVMRTSTSEVGAALIQFEPTPEIPVNNVQEAIERVQGNILDPLADYGLGVTGNADVLPDIDATDIPSGAYRFDGGTAGTFPSGISASTGGIVRLFRESSSKALMILTVAGSPRQIIRRLSTTWGRWARLISDQDTASDAVWAAGSSAVPYAISPQSFHAGTKGALNATGDAPVFAPRAWVLFNGSNGSILSAGNVASVTKNGTGDYTINFSSPMPHQNYAVTGSVRDGGAGVATIVLRPGHAHSTTQLRFQTRYATSGSNGETDSEAVSVMVFC